MEGDKEPNGLPTTAARRGRKRSAGIAAATTPTTPGRRKAPDERDAFDQSVRTIIAERIGGMPAATAVFAGGHFDQTLRSFHAMRGSVANADGKCADVIVDVLAAERAEQLAKARAEELDKRGGDPHQTTLDDFVAPPARVPTDTEAKALPV
jgi:hypothetical protein